MKVIKYNFLSAEVNPGTKEEPSIEQVILNAAIECPTQAVYDANIPIAEAEAIPGTLDLDPEGKFDPEPEPTPSGDSVWDELDAAYQRGVDSV